MQDFNPKISIIVPMHNSSRYIEECIDSVLSQKFSDFELLLIDDHSSDNTVEICGKYLENKKIKLLSNTGKRGVSSARNLGINNSRGIFITFVDSDDVLSESYLSVLYKIAEKYPEYLAMCSFIKFRDTIPAFDGSDITSVTKVPNETLVANIFYYHSSAWGCLFRTDIIRKYDIKMHEMASFNEDIYFTVKYASICRGSISVTNRLYGYRINSNGLGANKAHSLLIVKDVSHRAEGYFAFRDALSFAEKYAPEISCYINVGYSFIAAEVILTAERVGIRDFKLKKEIKKYLSVHCCMKYIWYGVDSYQKMLVIGIAISPKLVKLILDDCGLLEKYKKILNK